MQEKARYWCAVLYPENMIEDWQNQISDLIEFPFCYCVHDKDLDGIGEQRKVHMHIMIAYANTTTKSSVMSLLSRLNAPGHDAFNTIQAVVNVRHMYDYLIHDTEGSRKKKKHLYDKSERISGNNFDIGNFEQISIADKRRMLKEICDDLIDKQICNFAEAYLYITSNYDDVYFDVLSAYSSMIARITKGNFHRG